MIIPEDVNFKEFYLQAISKGIKITSKYAGVSIYLNKNGQLWWTASIRINGNLKAKHLGSFPFTKNGEIEAAEAYSNIRNKIPSKSNYKSKKIQI